jgi:hypothetical protein
MSNRARNLTGLLLVLLAAGCTQTTREAAMNPAQEYLQRADTITLSAGNAKEVNSRIHVIDPWPRYVGNTYIPANGERMAGAVERYRDTSKLNGAPRPLPLVGNDSTTSQPAGSSASQ